jgi:hypothetical protein
MAQSNGGMAARPRARAGDPLSAEQLQLMQHAGGDLHELSEAELSELTGGLSYYFTYNWFSPSRYMASGPSCW